MNLFDRICRKYRICRIKTEESSGLGIAGKTSGGHGQVPKCAMVNLWRGVDAGA